MIGCRGEQKFQFPAWRGGGGRGSMEGTLETSPSSSQGGDLIPYLALRDLSSSHTFAPLDDVRGGLRADQWQLLLS